jgi:hypothetical protein
MDYLCWTSAPDLPAESVPPGAAVAQSDDRQARRAAQHKRHAVTGDKRARPVDQADSLGYDIDRSFQFVTASLFLHHFEGRRRAPALIF